MGYHPQMNGQPAKISNTIVARPGHYMAEHQRKWDIYVEPLTYAHNMRVYRSTNLPPFCLDVFWQVLDPTLFHCPKVLPTAFTATTIRPFLPPPPFHRLFENAQDVENRMKSVQHNYEADRHSRIGNARRRLRSDSVCTSMNHHSRHLWQRAWQLSSIASYCLSWRDHFR